jgi:hypothetical protein
MTPVVAITHQHRNSTGYREKQLTILCSEIQNFLGVFPPKIGFNKYMTKGTARENVLAAPDKLDAKIKVKKKMEALGKLLASRAVISKISIFNR